jgi:hypothetical protein
MRGRWWIGVAAGMVLGLGTVIAVQASTGEASAQSGFTVSAEQLRINQRISQAAVNRSNESLNLLDPVRKSGPADTAPGWGTTQIADNAVTRTKLDSTLREGQPRWAVVAATTGNLVRGKNAVSSAKLPDPGIYTVTFDRDISACAMEATIGDGGTAAVTPGLVSVWRSATDPKVATVQTDALSGAPLVRAPTDTLPFHLAVLC